MLKGVSTQQVGPKFVDLQELEAKNNTATAEPPCQFSQMEHISHLGEAD
jgi:hypothetical protein